MISNCSHSRQSLAAFSILFAFFSLPNQQLHCAAQATSPSGSNSLQGNEQAVIASLDELNHLQQGTWRIHVGDVAHGEDTNLDDSFWPPAQPNSDYPADVMWFRQLVQVPATFEGYDLTGSRIWFQLIAHAHGTTPEIIYLNGRRVAMGEDLEPVVLFDHAGPGDKVLIAVTLLPTVGEKHFTGVDIYVEFSAGRPNPDNLREEFPTAAQLMPSGANDPPEDEANLFSEAGAHCAPGIRVQLPPDRNASRSPCGHHACAAFVYRD
jgi:alpha-mannosidase